MSSDSDRNADEELAEETSLRSRASGMTSRRKMMATGAATWATVGLAGCTGGGGDDDTTTAEPTTDEPAPGTDTPEPTPEPTPTPTPSPDPENYIVSTNTYWNGHPAPEGSGGYVGTCSPERQFRRDMDVTFVIGVYDADTGETVGDDVVDSVAVSFPDRSFSDVSLEFVPAEEEGDIPQWNGTFDIPDDAETGSVAYEIQVSDGDANFYEVGIAADSFSIIEPTAFEPNYVVTTNTYWNGHPAPDGTNGFVGACSPERQFRSSDMDVTFVIGIFNSETGAFVGGDQLDSVTVTFPETEEFDPVSLEFTPASENSEAQWHGTLDLEGAPAGEYTYQVNVEGGQYDVNEVGVASNFFEVISG